MEFIQRQLTLPSAGSAVLDSDLDLDGLDDGKLDVTGGMHSVDDVDEMNEDEEYEQDVARDERNKKYETNEMSEA